MGDRLRDKVCVITGTAGGMGRAAALRFAAEGARVVGCDVNAAGAAATLHAVEAAGGSRGFAPTVESSYVTGTDLVIDGGMTAW